ncbi:MAG: hypothetical protein EBT33_19425 [Betaproteobacteria bacterium]|nr:hypothetical protein [Betaproteobacteria bacterium]
MKFPQPSLARQALPDRPDGSTGGAPRLVTDSPTVRRVLELLTRERCSVLVTSQASGSLDLWGRTIAAALRSRADVVLEIYMPASAEALVARFNSAMSSHSLVSAQTDGGPGAALRVLLVPDSRALMTPEGQLLVRLVGDFPAAGVRLLVLADAEAEAANRTVRDILARRLRLVALESGSIDEPVPAAVSRDSRAEILNGRITLPAPVISPVAAYRAPALAGAVLEASRLPVRQPMSRGRRIVTWGALVLSIALIALLVVVLLYRDRSPAGAASIKPSQATPVPLSTVWRAAPISRVSQP